MFKWKQTGEGWYIQILVNYLSLVFWKGHQSTKYLMVHLWVRFPDGGLLNQRVNTCVILLAAVIQSLSCIRLFATPWTTARQASLSFAISWSLLKLMSIESMMSSNHLILCPLLLLPSIFPSIRVFQMSQLFASGGPKYWSFSFTHQSYQWTPRTDLL